MAAPSFTVRRMTRPELDLAVAWARAEGWNPGLHDADAFFTTDPQGFFLGVLEGEPIGCVSTVAYNATFGFLGFYIVRPDFRGRGYGMQIWNAGMAYLGQRNVGLDGVVAQQENYKKSGFRLAYRNIRQEGTGGGTAPVAAIPLDQVSFEEVLAYDSALFPVPRPGFLKHWLRRPDGAARGLLRGGKLAGYGVIRACAKGHKIGPLFADDERAAEDLFQALASRVPGEPIYLDTPEVNPAAVALARRHDLTPVFETARMYTRTAPTVPLERVFGVTTFELG